MYANQNLNKYSSYNKLSELRIILPLVIVYIKYKVDIIININKTIIFKSPSPHILY